MTDGYSPSYRVLMFFMSTSWQKNPGALFFCWQNSLAFSQEVQVAKKVSLL